MRHPTSFLSGLLVATWVATARSDTAPLGEVELDWLAPPECPTRSQVLEDARGLVTSEHPARPSERLTVRAVVELLADNRWRLRLSVGASRRQVEATSCAELGRATALFLALLVDPLRREAPESLPPPPPSPAPSRAKRAPSAPRPRRTPVPAGPTQAAQAARWGLGAGATFDYGTMPRPVLLGMLSASVALDRFELHAHGGVGGQQTRRLGTGGGAKLVPGLALLEACYTVVGGSALRLAPCVGVELGVVGARAFGLVPAKRGAWPWFGLDASLALTLVLGRHFELRTTAGANYPAYRPTFHVDGVAVHEPGPALRLGAAGLCRF